jgi:hypothetical protein
MLLELLAFYNQSLTFVKYYVDSAKQYARTWLGPEPQNWHLLPDGRVLPTTMPLPDVVKEHTYYYHVESQRITRATMLEPQGRFRPLNYIAFSYDHNIYGNAEITDWLGEIRANPVPDLCAKQLLTLYSLSTNHFLPLANGTRITVTKNTGDEEVIQL